MIGGMLFGGGIILTTCIERAVAKSNDSKVLQFWFTKVPLSLIFVVASIPFSKSSSLMKDHSCAHASHACARSRKANAPACAFRP